MKGTNKKREEARANYEAAKRRGNVAGLLDQERPNIFTQSVANILPGEKITVTISYVETLSYADGVYSLVFFAGGWSPLHYRIIPSPGTIARRGVGL